MSQLYMERTFDFDLPRDQVWEYMTDLRRAMTIDQFHVAIDCTKQEATNPKAGMVIPIQHRIMGWDETRLGRLTVFEDYQIAWGETTQRGEYDAFPHSEGWKIEEVDSRTSRVVLWLKGNWRTPVGSRVQPLIWNTVIGPNLDQDVQDFAHAVGATMSPAPEEVPPNANQLFWLAFAQQVNGQPAEDFFTTAPELHPAETHDLKADARVRMGAEAWAPEAWSTGARSAADPAGPEGSDG